MALWMRPVVSLALSRRPQSEPAYVVLSGPFPETTGEKPEGHQGLGT